MQQKDILMHCCCELIHAVWNLFLDDAFVHTFKYGIVIKCTDGVEHCVYPQFFTYSADYPEKCLSLLIFFCSCWTHLSEVCWQQSGTRVCVLVQDVWLWRQKLTWWVDITTQGPKKHWGHTCMILLWWPIPSAMRRPSQLQEQLSRKPSNQCLWCQLW